jgi:hypothetical protein
LGGVGAQIDLVITAVLGSPLAFFFFFFFFPPFFLWDRLTL